MTLKVIAQLMSLFHIIFSTVNPQISRSLHGVVFFLEHTKAIFFFNTFSTILTKKNQRYAGKSPREIVKYWFHTFFSHLANFSFTPTNLPAWVLQEYVWFAWVSYLKILYTSNFTPFFINFTPLFTPFSKFSFGLHAQLLANVQLLK